MKFLSKKSAILISALVLAATGCSDSGKGGSDNSQGLSYYNKGQYHSAVTSFEAAIAANKKNPDYYTNLGMTYIELENYEEGANGMVYCELVASTRNALGKTKNTRFGAVVEAVEADGNVVFKGAGPQLVTPLTGTKMLKTVLGFKAK